MNTVYINSKPPHLEGVKSMILQSSDDVRILGDFLLEFHETALILDCRKLNYYQLIGLLKPIEDAEVEIHLVISEP